MNKLSLLALLSILLLAIFLPAQVLAQPPDMYTYRKATADEPKTLDPHRAYDHASQFLITNVYETLMELRMGSVDELIPELATSWVISVDPQIYTCTIRTGVTFNNTYPLTAADVEYSFERGMVRDPANGPMWMLYDALNGTYSSREFDLSDPAVAADVGHMIDNAITTDETMGTVTFHLPRVYPYFLQIMAETWSSILDKEWMTRNYHFPGGAEDTFDWPGWDPTYTEWVNYNNYERELSTGYYGARQSPLDGPPQMLGTGPFVFAEWIQGEGGNRTLNANLNYWGGWPAGAPGTARAGDYQPSRGYILRMIEHQISNWTARKQGFLAGDYDWVQVPKAGHSELWQQPGVECIYPFYLSNVEAILPNWNIAGGINGLSPYVGDEHWGTGLPLDAFSDVHMRKAFAYCFDYTQYIFDYTAPSGHGQYLEGFQPASPIVVGLEPYNPRTLRNWHIANRYYCNLSLAVQEFQQAWGGQVWAQGFSFTYVYNIGNMGRQQVGLMFKNILEAMNPQFHVAVIGVTWAQWSADLFGPYGRSLFPLIPLMRLERDDVSPHAHNYIYEFMHSNGSLAYLQSYSNSTVDALIKAGNYDQLNQIYHNDVVSMPTVQDMDRRWQRDWIQGYRYNWWHYNPIYPGENLYTIWKEELPIQDITEDGKIDIRDLATAAQAYGMYYYQPYLPPYQLPPVPDAVPGWHSPNWNSRADIFPDKKIDIRDLASMAKLFGWTAPPWPPPPIITSQDL